MQRPDGASPADSLSHPAASRSDLQLRPAPSEANAGLPDRVGQSLLILLFAATALRLLFGAALGLGVDESYMVSSGRHLAWGYFDHPPAAWWLSWGAAHLFGTETHIAVRLPFIALFALSTWLMFRLGAAVADRRAGLWAAVLLNLSPVFGATTGTWVLPDGPLDCALIAAALCLVHALPARGRAAWTWWLAAGLSAGLGLFSKYTAVLTILGALGYLLSSRRHRFWLARPEPYVACVLALAVFAPVIIWNADHHWASFAFQGDRADAGVHFHPLGPLVVLGGEALFVLPWIWAPMMAVWAYAWYQGPDVWRGWLLACLGAPPIILFALIAAWSSQRVLFHWAAPGYLMLFPLLGDAVARRLDFPATRRILIGTVALVVGLVAIVSTQVRFDWLHPVIARVARQDPDLAAIDWTSLRQNLTQRGLLAPGTVVGVPNWRDAGKIAYALGPQVTILCLNHDSREFGIVHPVARYAGRNVLLLAPGHPHRAERNLRPMFTRLVQLPPAPIRHAGRIMAEVAVMQGYGLHVVASDAPTQRPLIAGSAAPNSTAAGGHATTQPRS